MKKIRIATIITLAISMLSLSLISCTGEVSFTTAKLSEVTMASSVDESTYEPIEVTDTFEIDTPEIFLSAKFSNAPADTEITAEWIYVEGEVEDMNNFVIDTVAIEVSGTDYLYFSMPIPGERWPRGQYKVDLYIDEDLDQTATFTVQ